ncbi:hypothetical protein [Azospirillum aestuarii]|uniref:hypothetical protein n=1 Tax=Azospirillum aestuarii TaxID=2802052 RepID=UPI0040553020
MIMIINDVMKIQDIKPNLLGWIEEDRAATDDGLLINHNYLDLRGFSKDDLDWEIQDEAEGFELLEKKGYSIEVMDELWQMSEYSLVPMIEFGVRAAVVAVSALGCVPITSCRGKSLDDCHISDAPSIIFYAHASHVPTLLAAARQSEVSITNNADMVEVFTDNLRLMNSFAKAILRILPG